MAIVSRIVSAATCSHSYIGRVAGSTRSERPRPGALVGRGSLRLEKDELSLEPQYSCAQHLLVVCEATSLVPLSLHRLLERANPLHEVAFTQPLQRVVRRARDSDARTSSTSTASRPSLPIGCALRRERTGCLAVQRVRPMGSDGR